MKTNMFKILPSAAAVSIALLSANVAAAEWHGYARSGIAMGDDGDQQCVDVRKVGRLGNECDTYAELDLQQDLFNRDGKSMRVETMIAYTSDQSNDWEGTGDDDANFAIRQMNIQAKGFLEFAPEATVWAGKRFYQRKDVHILDFYYWDVSGPGAGIEGIKLGEGTINFAWTRADRDDGFATPDQEEIRDKDGNVVVEGYDGEDAANVNIFDVRYNGLKLGTSSLDFGITYAQPNLTDRQDDQNKPDDAGMMLSGELTTPVLGGFNKLVLQYGTEGYAHSLRYFGGGNWYGLENAGEDGTAYRVIDWGVVKASKDVEVGYAFTYANYDRDDFDDAHTYWNAVVRPEYKWNDFHKTIFEVGYYDADDDAWGKERLSKFTVAQAIGAGKGFWARPELRVYATYVKDHENDSFGSNGDSDDTWSFGAQMEAWW